MFGFTKLEVWKLAIEFSDAVYNVTRQFPQDERFGLTNQLRRSVVSVAANIAEGSGRGSNRDFVRFIQMSFGSLMESVSHLTIAQRQGFLDQESFDSLQSQAERLAKMLSGLRSSLEKNLQQ